MSVILPNCYIDILRAQMLPSGATDSAQPYLQHIEGHISRVKDAMLTAMSTSTLKAEYQVFVDTSVDIQKGDQVVNIVRKDTGKPWFSYTDTEAWYVLDANNSEPSVLEYRDCVLGRYIAGGPIRQ